MNKAILMGRLTREPDVRWQNYGDGDKAIARFSLAVDRQRRKDGEREADFFNCTTFGKQAEFVEKYLHQGTKVLITGRIQNDTYTNREGQKVYSVQIIVQELEFCESKKNAAHAAGEQQHAAKTQQDGFMSVPDGVDDEELPFC